MNAQEQQQMRELEAQDLRANIKALQADNECLQTLLNEKNKA